MYEGSIFNSYTLIKSLHHLSFNQTWSAKTVKGQYCVLKFINITYGQIKQIHQKKETLQKSKDTNLLTIYQTFQASIQNRKYLIVVSQLCQSNFHLYITNSKIKEYKIIKKLLEISQGLKYLHCNSIMHRNIKPQNIFISQHIAKLGDLHLSKNFNTQYYRLTTASGPPLYMPPEMLHRREYTYSADIWQLGIVFLQTMLKQRIYDLYEGDKPICQQPNILETLIGRITHKQMKKLISKMLILNEQKRVDIIHVTKKLKHILRQYKKQKESQSLPIKINLVPQKLQLINQRQKQLSQLNQQKQKIKKEEIVKISRQIFNGIKINVSYYSNSDQITLFFQSTKKQDILFYHNLPQTAKKHFKTNRELFYYIAKINNNQIQYNKIKEQLFIYQTKEKKPEEQRKSQSISPTKIKSPSKRHLQENITNNHKKNNDNSQSCQQAQTNKQIIKETRSISKISKLKQQHQQTIKIEKEYPKKQQNRIKLLQFIKEIQAKSQQIPIQQPVKTQQINFGLNNCTLSQKSFTNPDFLALQSQIKEFQQMSEFSPTLGIKYSNLANLYSEIGQFTKSKQYNLNALKMMEMSQGEPQIIANTLHNLGNSYQNLQQYEMAITCYLDAESKRQNHNINSPTEKMDTKNSLACAYMALQKYSLAETILKSLIDEIQTGDQYNYNPKSLALALSNYGTLLAKQGMYEKAYKYYEKSMQKYQLCGFSLDQTIKLRLNKMISAISSKKVVQSLGEIQECFQILNKINYREKIEFYSFREPVIQFLKTLINQSSNSSYFEWVYSIVHQFFKEETDLLNKISELKQNQLKFTAKI